MNTRMWKWLAIMQRYDLDIQHIPGKVNSADHLSRQLLKESPERKGLVTKENQQFVEQLRVPRDATDVEIQDALCKIFQKERDRESGTEFSTEIEYECRSVYIIRQRVSEVRITAASVSEFRVIRTKGRISVRSGMRSTLICS